MCNQFRNLEKLNGITCSMGSRHMGQVCSFSGSPFLCHLSMHWRQKSQCPQGTTTATFSRSWHKMQMSSSSTSCCCMLMFILAMFCLMLKQKETGHLGSLQTLAWWQHRGMSCLQIEQSLLTLRLHLLMCTRTLFIHSWRCAVARHVSDSEPSPDPCTGL